MNKKMMWSLIVVSAGLMASGVRAEWGYGLGRECKDARVVYTQQSGWPCDQVGEPKREVKAVPEKDWRLSGVNFETGSDRLLAESQASLNEAAEILKDHPRVVVEIQGHTDNIGASADNDVLSQNRAMAVKKYLADSGVSSRRLKAKGYGASQPIASNDTEDGRAQNRRIEFKVLKR